MKRFTVYIKNYIHRARISITNLPFHLFGFKAYAKTETGRPSSTKILQEANDNAGLAVFRAPGYKLVYGGGEFMARMHAQMRAVAGKYIEGAKNAVAYAVMSAPVSTLVKWRILDEVDDTSLGSSDALSLRDLDYIELV